MQGDATIAMPNCQTTLKRRCPGQLPSKGTGPLWAQMLTNMPSKAAQVPDSTVPQLISCHAGQRSTARRAGQRPRPAGYHMAHTIPFQPSTHTVASGSQSVDFHEWSRQCCDTVASGSLPFVPLMRQQRDIPYCQPMWPATDHCGRGVTVTCSMRSESQW
jgi:hypothetical protein